MNVLLVGAGVVGCAIAKDHLLHGIPIWLSDRDENALRRAIEFLTTDSLADPIDSALWGARWPLPSVGFVPKGSDCDPLLGVAVPRWLVMESIAERLDVKRAFFAAAEDWFDAEPILTTNTSTLRIGDIASAMKRPERLLGLHFLMPVVGRHAAEVIPHARTAPEIIAPVHQHVFKLKKKPLPILDSPGFVVNRLLVPYLNLAMNLVCGGVGFETLRAAALKLGMPMSPLELIDMIGTRTAFDGGRVVWQAFPDRIDPSPLLPGLVKRGISGASSGFGFYLYENGKRIDIEPRDEIRSLIARYHRLVSPPIDVHDVNEIASRLAAVIAAEAATIISDGVANEATVAAAMVGGLGFCRTESHIDPSDHLQWVHGHVG